MPSVWFWTTIAELLTYGSTLILGALMDCGARYGIGVVGILLWLDGSHAWVGCSF